MREGGKEGSTVTRARASESEVRVTAPAHPQGSSANLLLLLLFYVTVTDNNSSHAVTLVSVVLICSLLLPLLLHSAPLTICCLTSRPLCQCQCQYLCQLTARHLSSRRLPGVSYFVLDSTSVKCPVSSNSVCSALLTTSSFPSS